MGSEHGYRVHPDAVRAVLAAVRAEPIDGDGIDGALRAALDGIRTVDDADTNDIISVLSGITGDVRAAPARIDDRVARAANAASAALEAVEEGDRTMSEQIAAAERSTLEQRARRFGSGP